MQIELIQNLMVIVDLTIETIYLGIDGLVRGFPVLLLLISVFLLYLFSYSIYLHFYKDETYPKDLEVQNEPALSVLIIIPTYNERNTIRNKLLDTLEIHYNPSLLEITVIDGASTDGTPEIVEEFLIERTTNIPRITLVKESERLGKSESIIECISSIEFGDIILVTDANCMLKSNCLQVTVPTLKNPSVGGISIGYNMQSIRDTWVERGERFYWKQSLKQRESESRKGIFFHFLGSFMMLKRKISKHAFVSGRNTYAEDMIGGLAVMLQGHQILHTNETKVIEASVSTLTDLYKQKKNRAIGLMDTFRFYMNSSVSSKKKYRSIVYFKTLHPLLTPFLIICILFSLIIAFPLPSVFLIVIFALIITSVSSSFRFFIVVQLALLSGSILAILGRRKKYWDTTNSDRHWPDSHAL